MNTQSAYVMLEDKGLLAGMRGDFLPEKALQVADVLVEAGITIFELTMNSPQPIAAMQAIKREFGDAVCAGMGTVLDRQTALDVLGAGADFIVSPAFGPEVVQAALDADVLVAPGVITPTECVNAWAMGVRVLKIFPIGSLGLDYFKSIYGPLSHMQFLANGGINPATARDYMQAGALCCGASSWLTGKGDWPIEKIRDRARQLVDAVEAGRSLRLSAATS